jgi:hypothetical protein
MDIKEEDFMEWTSMMKALNTCGIKNTLTVYWANGLIFEGFVDTMCETCNNYDMDDPRYIEYYMCVMRITDIIRLPHKGSFKEKIGDLVELSVLYEPIRIEKKGEGVLWQK